VLLFDEADALFGKRSAVHDAHDRYANIEVSYLLQKMEQHEGITILTSNLRGNIDEAFLRRLAFTVHFPFPDEQTRLEIWKNIWPPETRLDADVDLAALAERFRLSGGNIRNVALAASFLAAAESRPVGMCDLLRATRREYAKVGKTLTAAELEEVVR
jgi:SpoVK/Ycf46/Vps4 family AAA+-type ATPase